MRARRAGTSCHRAAHGVNQTAHLPLAEWEPALQPGDSVLDMDIPAGGGMTPEACRHSLSAARDFFAERFPETKPKAVVCGSWLFNTQLEEVLGPEANLVKFQRELYLYPVPSSGQDGLWFIFLQAAEGGLRPVDGAARDEPPAGHRGLPLRRPHVARRRDVHTDG